MKAISKGAKIFLLFFLLIVLTGCTIDVTVPADEPMRLSVYNAGQLRYERILANNDPVRQKISDWLATHRDGWQYAFITRIPRIYMAGKHFSINILENEVSVKYCHGIFGCHFWVKQSGDIYTDLQKISASAAEPHTALQNHQDEMALKNRMLL